MKARKGLVCLGNPVVDSYAFVEDKFLEKYSIPKGAAPIFPHEKVKEIISQLEFISTACGGSGLNVIKGLGLMGCSVGLIGQYSHDEDGMIVKESLKKHNIKDLSTIKEGYTTRINTFITPDKQRTMLALFGVSHEERTEKLNPSVMDEYEYFLIEGYHFCNKPLLDLSEICVKHAVEQNMKIVLTLSNIFCVESFKNHLLPVMEKSFIVSGNEEEFLKMFDKDNVKDLLEHVKNTQKEKIIIITLGNKGAYAVYNGQEYFTEAPDVKALVDTTGAGDLFVSGFLYGYLNNCKIETCLEIANLFAGDVISKIGTDLCFSIKQKAEEIVKNENK